MMSWPLTIASLMRWAERHAPDSTIAAVDDDTSEVRRSTYRAAFERVHRLANALRRAGVRAGDRVATVAWNTQPHFELYYAVSCLGAVLHTVNPRLEASQLEYVIRHGGAEIVFVDPLARDLLDRLQPLFPAVRQWITLGRAAAPRWATYEDFIQGHAAEAAWPALDEGAAAALCYTSGTTGEPKGVLYTHRSTVLHALISQSANAMAFTRDDVVLPVVPMYHVMAWGTPYSAVMAGATLVLPGHRAGHAAFLADLIDSAGVTVALGVPTVWLGVLQHLRESGRRLKTLRRVIVGGAACPPALMDALAVEAGITVQHAWGMTELSPLGTFNRNAPGGAASATGKPYSQGQAVFGVELRVVDGDGRERAFDGHAQGRLQVRGPAVCAGYFQSDDRSSFHEGWFDTGDVATIGADGHMRITDRAKDVIKSGGEWISSVELENVASRHPAVLQAAAIAVPNDKWGERPWVVVVRKDGAAVSEQEIRHWFVGKVAHWAEPDRVVFAAALPLTATGKVSKRALRDQYGTALAPDGASHG
ncbi:MAG: long-chain fatty acid--CoA ligase [Steroidobacteraceae bacterium]|jgi:fatty-acyl-CoA synthase|nr:long-chain fatty acid--CoA ligase [Steroidobacteraceae bacterium]